MSRLLTLGAGGGDDSFGPGSVSGLLLWFKADAITGLSDTDPVGTWNDSSGNGYNLTQGTAGNKPLYRTNQQNSQPAVVFDATDDFMATAAVTYGVGADAEFYWVAALKRAATTPAQAITICGANGTNWYWRGAAADLPRYEQGANVGNFNTALTTSTWYILEGYRSGTTTNRFAINGTQEAASVNNNNPITDGTFNVNSDTSAGANFGLATSWGEFCLYNALPSAGNRTSLRSYLSVKWNIASS